VTRDRLLKALVLLMVGGTLGAAAGGTLTAHAVSSLDEDKAEERAYYARCLFRVAERHVGHERLIAEWRAEVMATRPARESVPVEAPR
jgi:hypothetical protein